MKHTIKGRHGHCYKSTGVGLKFIKECIPVTRAAKMDLLTGKLELMWKISRRYHVCATCWKPTETIGGYATVKPDKILFYECERCG